MTNSWSGLRKELEQDFLCNALKGRVQYFITHYRDAHDDYGRICIRVDGKEQLMGNPYAYGVKGYCALEMRLKREQENPLVRMFAVLDRRVGKRTLLKLATQIEEQPQWLQFFYMLRLDAETIPYQLQSKNTKIES